MVKILITGSSGMLGRDLCEVLGKGHEVVGLDVSGCKLEASGCARFYETDITDAAAIGSIFDKEKPDVVIHAAAWADVDGCELDPEKAYKVNADGTRNIAEAAAVQKAPMVYISTDFVFNGKKDTPYTEDDECNPINVYGKSKLDGEKAVQEAAADYMILRTSWLYGPGGKNFVDTIVVKSGEGKPLKIVDDQTGSPTYTRDLAETLNSLISSGVSGERSLYNACGSGACTWYGFAVKIKELVPRMKDAVIEPISSDELGRPAERPRYSVLDNSRLREKLSRDIRPWDKALEEYIDRRHN